MLPPRLTIELIPSTAWGNNLRSHLHRSEWDRVSRGIRRKAGDLCQICGSGIGYMHCHEVWGFTGDTQKLVDLQCLCNDCHMVKHFGLATLKGQLGKAMSHLLKINKWTRSEAQVYIEKVNNTWKERNKKTWKLDLSKLQQLTEAQCERKMTRPRRLSGHRTDGFKSVPTTTQTSSKTSKS